MLSREFHKDLSSFTLLTSEINAIGLSFSKEIKAESLNCLLKEENSDFCWHTNSSSLPVFFIKEESEQSYVLEIKARFNLLCSCVRCLKNIEHELNLDFKIRLLDKEKILDESDDLSCEIFFADTNLASSYENEMPVSYFSKDRIDLALILREQIFLELPDYPACGNRFALNKSKCQLDFINISDNETLNFNNPFFKLLEKNYASTKAP